MSKHGAQFYIFYFTEGVACVMKKILLIFAAYLFVVLLTACGGTPETEEALPSIETAPPIPTEASPSIETEDQVSAETQPSIGVAPPMIVETPSQNVEGWTTITWPGWFSVCIPPEWQAYTHIPGPYDDPFYSLRVSGEGVGVSITDSPLAISTLLAALLTILLHAFNSTTGVSVICRKAIGAFIGIMSEGEFYIYGMAATYLSLLTTRI